MNGYMLKIFVFENELTYHSFTMQLPIPVSYQPIDIQCIVSLFKTVHSISEPLIIKVYDPIRDRYVDPETEELADKNFLFSPMIMIKYRVTVPEEPQIEDES